MNTYSDWLKAEGFSHHTVRRYLTVQQQFIVWYESVYEKPFSPEYVSPGDLQDWKIHLLETRQKNGRKYAISTINSNIESIKSYFRYLTTIDKIDTSPSLNLKKQSVQRNRIPKWLSIQDETNLRFYVDHKTNWRKWQRERNRAIFYTMLFSGLRISEVAQLELDDFSNGFIIIRDGKGGKSREVYMNQELALIMKEWIKVRETKNINTTSLFTSQKGGGLTVSGIKKIFEELRSETGIKELTPHVLRHTCGHNLIVSGASLNQVADILGHDNLETTRGYTQSSTDEQIQALNKLR